MDGGSGGPYITGWTIREEGGGVRSIKGKNLMIVMFYGDFEGSRL